MAARRVRLAFVVTHPIPNQIPLYQALAAHPEIELTVFFASHWGLQPSNDPQFGRAVAWDVPLTGGYRHHFLRNANPLPVPRLPIGLLNPALPWRLRRGRFDAVIVHGYATLPSLLAILTAKLAHIPVLLRVETPPRARPWYVRPAKRAYLKLVFAGTAAFLHTGSAARRFCLAYGAKPRQLFVAPYAVENTRFAAAAVERDAARAELDIGPDRCAVLFCAKLIPLKRPLDVVQAIAAAGDRRLLLLVAGDGELREQVAAEARRLDVDVRLLGFVNQAGLPRVYAAADLLVLASESETWGLVVNEAMAAGLPVLVTRTAGCAPDLVYEGENGRTFAPGDVAALARGLAELAGNPELRQTWAARSRQIVRGCSFAADVDGILAALRTVSKRAKRGNR